MSRKKIVAGNWKMNLNLFEGKQLVSDLLQKGLSEIEGKVEVIVAPPFTQLGLAASQVKDVSYIHLGAQNCHQKLSGAYTGEVSVTMLKSEDVEYVILGHSERREYFNETPELLKLKVDTVLAEGLKVIFCVGEELSVREANEQNQHIEWQLKESLAHLTADQFKQIVIAYEPIWAIGTGKTASAEQAEEMHEHIRKVLTQLVGADTAENVSILYGGSVKAANAKGIFSKPNVDGGLIGGASLVADDFAAIIKAAL